MDAGITREGSMRERMNYLGINGYGWVTRVRSRKVVRTVHAKVFYLTEEF